MADEFAAGDRVVWDRPRGGPVVARVLEVRDGGVRYTIACEHPAAPAVVAVDAELLSAAPVWEHTYNPDGFTTGADRPRHRVVVETNNPAVGRIVFTHTPDMGTHRALEYARAKFRGKEGKEWLAARGLDPELAGCRVWCEPTDWREGRDAPAPSAGPGTDSRTPDAAMRQNAAHLRAVAADLEACADSLDRPAPNPHPNRGP